jgi:hypothetical protein
LRDVALRRLRNQGLTGPKQTGPADVVRRLGAVQAQDYPAAKWALGLRCRGVVDADVEAAFDAGTIIRTHVLRPTWHFVDPADLRWLLALTGPRVNALNEYAYRQFELDASVCRRGAAVIAKALRDGAHRTRPELGQALTGAGIDMGDPRRLSHLMMRLELDGVICSGPRRGKQFTYALLEERVPAAQIPGRDESLALLAARYFATRGPATAHDLAWWSGLTVADARRAAAAAGLPVTMLGGAAHWGPSGSRSRAGASPVAHLFPNYDEYFIGYRDRSAAGDRVRGRTLPPRTLWSQVAAVGGQVVGGWRRELGRDGVRVVLDPLVRLTPAEQKAVRSAGAAYGAFLELPAVVTSR